MLFRLPPEVLLLLIPVLLFALVFHEFSHGWVANKLGDPISAKLEWLPIAPVSIDKNKLESLIRFIEVLEDNDDVQDVYYNFEVTKELLETISN